MYNYDNEMLYEPMMLTWSFVGGFSERFSLLGTKCWISYSQCVGLGTFVIAIIYCVPSGYPDFHCDGGTTTGGGRDHESLRIFSGIFAYMVSIHILL